MGERIYKTGLVAATSKQLRELADALEHWRRGDASGQADLQPVLVLAERTGVLS